MRKVGGRLGRARRFFSPRFRGASGSGFAAFRGARSCVEACRFEEVFAFGASLYAWEAAAWEF